MRNSVTGFLPWPLTIAAKVVSGSALQPGYTRFFELYLGGNGALHPEDSCDKGDYCKCLKIRLSVDQKDQYKPFLIQEFTMEVKGTFIPHACSVNDLPVQNLS
jgi:hypothetical protein